MVIPVNRTQPKSLADWRARNPGKGLLFLPSKRDGKTLVYEKTHKGRVRVLGRKLQVRVAGRLAPSPNAAGAGRQVGKLKLRWILTRFVRMRPTLRLFESWQALAGERDKQWQTAADRMIRDLVRADPRDL
jgi:hypothetical protein